jgi:hypothetical protein
MILPTKIPGVLGFVVGYALLRQQTQDVLDHYIKCFFEFDLEGILSDYAPGAVLGTDTLVVRDKHALTSF